MINSNEVELKQVIDQVRELEEAHAHQALLDLVEEAFAILPARAETPESAALRAEILVLRGRARFAVGQWAEAEQDARAVLTLAPQLTDRSVLVAALQLMGDLQKDRGDLPAAEESHGQALKLAQSIGDIYGEARSSLALAGLVSRGGGRKLATENLEKCLSLVGQLPDTPHSRRLRAAATVEQAVERFREGLVDQTMTLCAAAVEMLDEDPLAPEVGEAYRFMGVAASTKLQHKDALAHHVQALQVYKNCGHRFGQAKIYHSIGQSFLETGRSDEALHYLEKSERICQDLGAHGEAASLYGHLGRVYLQREEYEKAARCFNKDLEAATARKSGRRALAHIHRNLGQTLLHVGDADGAKNHCKLSLQLFQEAGDQLNTARIYQDLVYIYNAQGDFPRALNTAQFAINMFRKLDHPLEVAWMETLIGVAYRGQKKWAEAEEHFKNAHLYFDLRQPTERLVRTMYEYGQMLIEVGDASRARRGIELYVEALNVARTLGLKRLSERCFEAIEKVDEIFLIRTLMGI